MWQCHVRMLLDTGPTGPYQQLNSLVGAASVGAAGQPVPYIGGNALHGREPHRIAPGFGLHRRVPLAISLIPISDDGQSPRLDDGQLLMILCPSTRKVVLTLPHARTPIAGGFVSSSLPDQQLCCLKDATFIG